MKEYDHEIIDALVARTADRYDRALIRYVVASYVTAEAERDAARALAEERAGALQSAFNFIEGSSTSPFGPRYAIKGISEALSPTDPLRSRIPESNAIDYKRLAEGRAAEIARLEGDTRVLLHALNWLHSAFSVYDRTLMDRTPDQRRAMDNVTEVLRDIARRAVLAAVPTREEGDADARQ